MSGDGTHGPAREQSAGRRLIRLTPVRRNPGGEWSTTAGTSLPPTPCNDRPQSSTPREIWQARGSW